MSSDRQRYEVTQAIDSKAASLLTHISIMTAVASLFFLEAKGEVLYQRIFLAEILAYIVVALATFLVLGGVRGGPRFGFREATLGLCYGLSAIITLSLLATLSAKYYPLLLAA